ncbi:hypothetical protein V6R21_24120 [Limibacter armeniacum]|uniref:hypothetical protein n=1 Tax=Limibacter armeniacum TaxID=466084 RepID=UPI002FE6BE24
MNRFTLLYKLLLICSLGVVACQSQGSFQKANTGDPQETSAHIAYQLEAQKHNTSEVGVVPRMVADPETGYLSLNLLLQNLTEEAKVITLKELSLITRQGVRSPSLEHAFTGFILPAKSDSVISVTFNPINDLKLYQQVQLHGSLQPIYQLEFALQQGDAQPLDYQFWANADEEMFTAYKDEWNAMGVPSVYQFAELDTAKETRIIHHLEKLYDDQRKPFVRQAECELIANGLLLKAAVYHHQDSLYITARWVNHSTLDYVLIPDSLTLYIEGNPTVCHWSVREQNLVIRKSQRLTVKTAVHSPSLPEKIALGGQGLQTLDRLPAYPVPLLFKYTPPSL